MNNWVAEKNGTEKEFFIKEPHELFWAEASESANKLMHRGAKK